MKKLLILILVLTLVIPSSYCKSEEVLIVDQETGKGDFNSIQKAINQAEPGQTIQVTTGTYKEDLTIDKPELTLKGVTKNQEKPIITGTNDQKHSINIKSDKTTIKGFVIKNPDEEGSDSNLLSTGIRIESNANIISENILKKNIIGLYLESSQSNTIYKNEFTYNDVGIYSWDQERIDIKSNLITDNYRAGTLIGLTKDMKIENNQIKNNKIGITLDESYDNLIRNNTISKNVEGFWIDEYSGQNHIYLNDIKSNNQQVNLNTNTYQNDAESEVSTNTWQSPFKITYTVENETESYLGNYWSNYDGEDENKDAIGDTHYEIGGEEVDRYPIQKSKTYYLSPETYNTTEESDTEEFDPEVPSDKYIFLWIINENNTKLSNVTVKIKRNNELISNKTTNEKGLALFSLEPGEYNVKLEKNNITAQKTIWKPAYTLKGERLTFNLTKD